MTPSGIAVPAPASQTPSGNVVPVPAPSGGGGSGRPAWQIAVIVIAVLVGVFLAVNAVYWTWFCVSSSIPTAALLSETSCLLREGAFAFGFFISKTRMCLCHALLGCLAS